MKYIETVFYIIVCALLLAFIAWWCIDTYNNGGFVETNRIIYVKELK